MPAGVHGASCARCARACRRHGQQQASPPACRRSMRGRALGRVGGADHQHPPGRLRSSPSAPARARAAARAAISAAIFGVAPRSRPCDQPPVSRMLTKRIGRSCDAGAPRSARSVRGTAGFPACRRRAGRRRPWPRAGRRPPRAGTRWCGRSAARRRRQARAPGQARAVQRHRLVAVADQGRHRAAGVGVGAVVRARSARPRPGDVGRCAMAEICCGPRRRLSALRRRTGRASFDWRIWRSIASGNGSGLP